MINLGLVQFGPEITGRIIFMELSWNKRINRGRTQKQVYQH